MNTQLDKIVQEAVAAALLTTHYDYVACHDANLERIIRRAIADAVRESGAVEAREIEELRKGLAAALELIKNSYGVAGLHLNGDVAPWHELRTGGRFEGWLLDFDQAIERLPSTSQS